MTTPDEPSLPGATNQQPAVTTTSSPSAQDDYILQAHDLRTYFPVRRGVFSRIVGWVRAVDGLSLAVRRGKTLGLVGESGCGKTTVGRTILRLIPATSGRVIFDGIDLFALPRKQLRAIRRQMQIIFQDPIGSLNPRMSVGSIVGEALTVHRIARRRQRRDRVAALLERVGLSAADMNRYPHEFSGGQRQRIGIARALALEPRFIVCDEPVSALDVSIQSQILNLLKDLQNQMSLSYLFIAHNLAVVEHFSDDVAVMYLGKIVELASAEQIYRNPKHPYTQALLSAVLEPDPHSSRRQRRVILSGEVPSPIHPPAGCRFHPRCPLAVDRCRIEPPALEPKPDTAPGHLVACHLADQIRPTTLADLAGSAGHGP
ncbi:MAG: ABC transporter ATP-binding protein [Phycisphaerae bacterium]